MKLAVQEFRLDILRKRQEREHKKQNKAPESSTTVQSKVPVEVDVVLIP
jgi:hypothetical protein